jgi:phospholipid/cholesterol/gamma-HCH transport system substrate-binding protein
MVKQAPTFGRLMAMAVFALSCFGLLLFLWISFGGATPLKPRGYRFQAVFPAATQLAEQGDVRVSGVPVGRVVKLQPAPGGRGTLATMQLDNRYAPVASDARAMLRTKTLLGETYVELTLGSPNAPPLKEGGRLADGRVREGVQLDEILGALNGPTRRAFRTWQQELGRAVRDRGPAINATLAGLPDFAGEGADVLQVLDDESGQVRAVVRDTGRVLEAISRRPGRLQSLVTSSAGVFGALSRRQDALAETVSILPTFMRELRATLTRTDRFAQQADPVIQALRPAVSDLRPAVQATRTLAPDLRSLALQVPGLTRAADDGLPAARDVIDGLRPLLQATGPLLSELNPILEWLEYNQALTISLFNAPNGLAYTIPTETPGSVGRVLRSLAPAGMESLALWADRLPQHRGNAYLPPDVHAGKRYAHEMMQPSWDCANTGRGEFTTDKHDSNAQPSCWTTGWPGRPEKAGQLPHIERADYAKP